MAPNTDKRAVISIEPDGTIYIDGPKIVIGGREAANPHEGEQVYIGEGATESLLLSELTIAALENYANAIKTAFSPAGDSQGNMGFFVNAPSLQGAAATLKTELEAARSKIAKTK